MGNWMSVQIIGTCGTADIPELAKTLKPGRNYDNFHCLVNGGMMGLPNWAAENIDAVGNLAERGYDHQDIADQLEKLAVIAPSLNCKVHCGGDFESKTCVATVTLESGKAMVGPAEIETVGEVTRE